MASRKDLLSILKEKARSASRNAYCRYSQFPVGAALATKDGKIFTGCNVENFSYGLTNCAERTAIFTAIASGVNPGEITTLVIYTPGKKLYSPCGACRQVMAEFMEEESLIFSTCDENQERKWKLKNLLPEGFQF